MFFGSEEFRGTVIGRATMAAVEDVIGQLIALFQQRNQAGWQGGGDDLRIR